MRLIIAAIAVALAFPAPSVARQAFSGNELQLFCSNGDEASKAICLSFVMGVVEGMHMGAMVVLLQVEQVSAQKSSTSELNKTATTFLGVCGPENGDYFQYRDIVAKYLAEHPEERHFGARLLVYRALRKAFPC